MCRLHEGRAKGSSSVDLRNRGCCGMRAGDDALDQFISRLRRYGTPNCISPSHCFIRNRHADDTGAPILQMSAFYTHAFTEYTATGPNASQHHRAVDECSW
jgi:hypothetical protein